MYAYKIILYTIGSQSGTVLPFQFSDTYLIRIIQVHICEIYLVFGCTAIHKFIGVYHIQKYFPEWFFIGEIVFH